MYNAGMVNGFSQDSYSMAQGEASKPKREWHHNPNPGSITPSQITGLKAFTARNGQDLQEVSQRKFGVPVKDMSSKQADELFGIFRNRRA